MYLYAKIGDFLFPSKKAASFLKWFLKWGQVQFEKMIKACALGT
jgi:hypothetical protein